jgi:prophage regulatory protein
MRLPSAGFVRLHQILGDQETPGLIPLSRSTWYAGMKTGRYPKPVKLGKRIVAWRVEDIKGLIDDVERRGRI